MPAGSLVQLVARGQNDIFLTYNPEITPFKIVYRRITNFAMFPARIPPYGKIEFGRETRFNIKKNADLVNYMCLNILLPKIQMYYPGLTVGRLNYNILAPTGVMSRVSGNSTDIVTVAQYNTLVTDINAEIVGLVSQYNTNLTYISEITDIYNTEGSILTGRTIGYPMINVVTSDQIYEPLIQYFIAYQSDFALNNPFGAGLTNYFVIQQQINASLPSLIILFNPTYPRLTQNVLMYQVVDFGSYIINQANIGVTAESIFLAAINGPLTYAGYDNNFTLLEFFNKLVGTPEETVSNSTDVAIIKNQLLPTLQWNITDNILEFMSFMTILQSNIYNAAMQFRIGIFKIFTFISAGVYDGSQPLNILNNNTDPLLVDFFNSVLTIMPPGAQPATVDFYFGDTVATEVKQFDINLVNIFQNSTLLPYFGDIKIWQRLIMSTYFGNTPSTWGNFNNVLVMNLIPQFVIYDIPQMVYNFMLASPTLSIYAPFFNLNTPPTFPNSLAAQIAPYYNAFIMPGNIYSIQSYLSELNAVYNSGSNYLMVYLLKPELLLNINLAMYDPGIQNELVVTYGFTFLSNVNNLILIQFVVFSYFFQYMQMINDFVLTPEGSAPGLKQILVTFILTNCVSLFIYPNLPAYSAYVANNYSLFGIGTNSPPPPTSPIAPTYMDAASSIYYNSSLSAITDFNQLFNGDTGSGLMEPDYYANNLGFNMVDVVDEFQSVLSSNLITYDPNFVGFDFFRLRLPSSAYTTLYNFYSGMLSAYYTLMNNYFVDRNMFNIEYISFNVAQNYFRTVDAISALFRNQVLSNPSIYFPVPIAGYPYPGVNPVTILNELLPVSPVYVNSIQNFPDDVNPLDIVNLIGDDVAHTIASGAVNPYNSVTQPSLYAWFNANYPTYITTLFQTQFNTVVNANFNFADTTNLFNNNNVYAYYNGFESSNDMYNFMIDSTINEEQTFVPNFVTLVGENNTTLQTYNNFIAVLNANNASIVNTLLQVATYTYIMVGPLTIYTWGMFSGSVVDQQIKKLIFQMQPTFKWNSQIGLDMINRIYVQIDGTTIDLHTSNWLKLWHMITIDYNKERAYNIMIGNVPELYDYNTIGINSAPTNIIKNEYQLMVPLEFWFNRHFSESLPLVALQYADVDICVEFKELNQIATWDTDALFVKPPKLEGNILANYTFVDKDERDFITTNQHNYLMELVQNNGELVYGQGNLSNDHLNVQVYFGNQTKMFAWNLIWIQGQTGATGPVRTGSTISGPTPVFFGMWNDMQDYTLNSVVTYNNNTFINNLNSNSGNIPAVIATMNTNNVLGALVGNVVGSGTLEVGDRFQTGINVNLLGGRFYKPATETGTHTLRLWNSLGVLIASVVVTGETSSGWQYAFFASPVALSPSMLYVISYGANTHWIQESGILPVISSDGNVFISEGQHGSIGTFPGTLDGNLCYFVDPLFEFNSWTYESGTPMMPMFRGLWSGAVGVVYNINDVVNYNNTQFINVLASNQGNPPSTTPSFNTANIIGALNIAVTPMGPVSHELGDLFYLTETNNLIGARFYRSPMDTVATHTVNLWNTSTQTIIASFTTTSETSSGWQYGMFPFPIILNASTNYIISFGTRYWEQSSSPVLPITNFNGTAIMVGGYFDAGGIGTYPINSNGGICYMVDPLYEYDSWNVYSLAPVAPTVSIVNNEVYIGGNKILRPVTDIALRFNGTYREDKKNEKVFRAFQPYISYCGSLSEFAYMYTFAIDPLVLQPSGSCNLTKINQVVFEIYFDPAVLSAIQNGTLFVQANIYNFAYNFLRVMSGMAALAFM